MLIQQLGSFKDLDFRTAYNEDVGTGYSSIQAFESGIAAAQAVALNTTQLLVYSNSIFNGTSRGIMPVPNLAYHLNNWTRMEVYQQGLTADVSCEVTNKQDPTFNVSQETGNIFNTQYQKITLSCNGTSDSSGVKLNSTLDPDNIIPAAGDSYLFFTICPYMNPDAPRNTFTVYMQVLIEGTAVSNMVCTIKPQLLNVTVTYENTGIVSINSTTEIPTDLPVNTSSVAQSVIAAVRNHLPLTQSSASNSVVDTLYGLTPVNLYHDVNMSWSQVEVAFSPLMAAYIQGAIEATATALRQSFTSKFEFPDMPGIFQTVSTKTYMQVIVWGQVAQLRLMIIIAPMAIMISTISLVLLSFYRARHLRLKYDSHFDPMDVLHIIAACSSGNVQTITFPGYSNDISAFCKYVDVELPEGRTGDDQGFRFSEKT
ncbi:hypothetical protein AX14_001497 [Amanita brunnescens Koide BX004]|nr:hypothetical protein AX14_003191 [Amanita brunnescens Koide BX004]KAF8697054.1 hypothetical protein AX14_001497 [Amanita brunnescens Koide BX004]